MNIININPTTSECTYSIQSWNKSEPPNGYAIVPDEIDLTDFYAYNGFVTLTIENNILTSYIPNVEAWEYWRASLPEPEPEQPTAQEDTDAMLVDHEYRLTLLELGVM